MERQRQRAFDAIDIVAAVSLANSIIALSHSRERSPGQDKPCAAMQKTADGTLSCLSISARWHVGTTSLVDEEQRARTPVCS